MHAGAFTSEDLHKALKDLGEGTSAKDIDAIIAGLDTDGDGVIDFAQFVLVMMHNVRKVNLIPTPFSEANLVLANSRRQASMPLSSERLHVMSQEQLPLL